MKMIFRFVAIAVLTSGFPSAFSQDSPTDVGFIQLINAIAQGKGNAKFEINGEELYPNGYKLGDMTGGFGLKVGTHEVAIKKEGVLQGNTKLSVVKGETMTLIGFAERKESKKEGDPPVWQTKILRLRQNTPGPGYHITFISVCDKPVINVETLAERQKNSLSHSIKRLATTSFRVGGGQSEVEVKVNGKLVTHVSTDDPGNYVVLLYQDAAGEIKALSFFDPKFVIAG
jgi:hypothetical protein